MRYVLIAIAGITAVFTLIATCTHHHPGVGSPAEWFVTLLYYPALIAACATACVSFWGFFWDYTRISSIVAFLLSLPMVIYGLYMPEYPYDKNMFSEEKAKGIHSDVSYVLVRHLLWYYDLYPEKFKHIGQDEEVNPEGFYDFVKHLKDTRGYGRAIREQNGQFIDPWGRPYRYFLDRDHDGSINGFGDKISITGAEDSEGKPIGSYTKAVGIGSEHMKFPEPWSDTREREANRGGADQGFPPWREQFGPP